MYSTTVSENRVDRDNQQITVLSRQYANDTVMGNGPLEYQMLSVPEAAWLAGFLDADGMIRLRIGRKNKVKHAGVGPKSLVPLSVFTGTCGYTMKRIAEMLSRVYEGGFMPTISGNNFRLDINQHNEKWAPKWDIEIGGINRVMPLIQLLQPYLVTKGTEAELMLMFCELRLQKGRAPYGALEYQIFEALKYCKVTRHLRDYTPSAEQVLREDIVRSSAEALEVAEMSTRLPIEARREWAKNLVSEYRWSKTGQGKQQHDG